MTKKAIIIGAGPAGLTAAYELLNRTDIKPIVLEKSVYIGGISRTIDYKGNRMDMGPHRFFSKSDRVMNWWLRLFPLQASGEVVVNYQNKSLAVSPDEARANHDPDKVMLVIQRLTRIYFLRNFFSYPIQLSLDTLRTLGFIRTIRILFSFLWIRLFPRRPEKSLEDFIINKFGRQLYLLFFKDYTEKVWGVPCHQISAEWGAQRIKGVSLSKAIAQAVKSIQKDKGQDISQKGTETSLIEQFLYPKKGPGSLWEEVARQVEEMGGEVHLNQDVTQICQAEGVIKAVTTVDIITGEARTWEGDYFFSTMPVQELIAGMDGDVPEDVQKVAAGLQYRDFINVGILLRNLSTRNKQGKYEKLELKDNWIYIQERDVRVGRLMIYNNWGHGMVSDPNTTWIGMEYFCNKTDEFWSMDNEAIKQVAIQELEQMELGRVEDVLDTTVRRMEKTYPAYFGTYDQFDKIRVFTDSFPNLFLIGRNGMHKYNNADHSMLTAMVAVDNILTSVTSKENLWSINTEQEYHEEKAAVRQELTPSFFDYVWKNKLNRAYVLCAFAFFLLQFILFKARYPFANYMPDSYSYLEAAYTNADVNMWPVAYSKFLRLISVFTHSDKILAGLQYFGMQAAGLLFLFTLFYFLKPGKAIRNTLLIFSFFNPVPLYIANYISADALFISLSLLWFSSLVWIIYKPQIWQIFLQAALLLACFTLRYNAIYYPLAAIAAFILARRTIIWRLGGVALGLALILGSITYTSHKMKELTGKPQFSAFGGWQLANNALYMYEHIKPSERRPVPARFASLETMVRQHMDTLRRVKLTHEDSVNSYFYLWNGRGPLIQYLNRQFKKDSTTSYLKRWAIEGPLYLDYAQYLIRQYPWSFLQNFMLPNAVKWAMPPTEFLGTYNMGGDSVGALAKNWFHYKSQRVTAQNKRVSLILFTEWYPIFSVLINLLLLIHLTGMIVFGSWRGQSGEFVRLLIISLTLWGLNAGFSIFASPIVLRYQYFPILVSFCFALFIGEIIYKQSTNQKM